MNIPSIPYPDRISLARTPTPLEPMPRLSKDASGPPLWIKRDDMTGLELSGNKSRKLEFLIARAQAEHCDCLFTYGGIQSNHCRATAAIGARLGMHVCLVLRGDSPHSAPDGNLLLDHLFGAEVYFVPREEFIANKQTIIDQTMAKLRSQGRKPYYFPVGASVPLGVWGYVRCLEEIRDQAKAAGVSIRHIYVGVGSGGTVAGLILGKALLGWNDLTVTGVAVASTEAAWKVDIAQLLEETCREFNLDVKPEDMPINVTDHYVGEGYAIPYREEIEVIQKTARLEGILLDPVYTGKAMTGLLDRIKRGEIPNNEPAVFVHTGGVFGLFPMREEFV